MILRSRIFLLALFASLFASCFKEDDPVVLPGAGEVQMDQVAMGPDYLNQIYYKLPTKTIFTSDYRSWDLAFETTSGGFHIWVNGGNQILVSNTNSDDFDHITDTLGSHWMWDASSGNKDSTAIGEWVNFIPTNPSVGEGAELIKSPGRFEKSDVATTVFLVDLGPDTALASNERFKKIVFETVNNHEYTFKYANIDGSDFHQVTIDKEPEFAFTYFSIRNGGMMVHPEPIKKDWDILFTRYRTQLFSAGNYMPYVVTGVLINPDGYSVAVDSSIAFTDADYDFAKNLTYKTNRDAIGYEWKKYLFNPPTYEVYPQINYFIKDKTGFIWKLHFISFYNDQGVKGYPQFEFQRL